MASNRANLQTIISADASRFSATMRKAGGTAAATGKRIAKGIAVGGAALAAIGVAAAAFVGVMSGRKMAGGIKNALDLGGALSDVAAQTGLSAGQVAVLQRAFTDNGISGDKLGGVINKMQKAIIDMGDGLKAPTDAFAELGISIEDIKDLSPSDQFALIAKRISAISDPAMRAAASMRIFGKSGGELNVLFADGGAIDKAGKSLGRQAEILDRRAGDFDRAADLLAGAGVKVQGFFVGMADKVVDPLLKILNRFDKIDFASLGQQVGQSLAPLFEKVAANIDGIVLGMTTALEYAGRFISTLASSEISESYSKFVPIYFESLKLGGRLLAEYLIKGFAAALAFFKDTFSKVTVLDMGKALFRTFARILFEVGDAIDLLLKGTFTKSIEGAGSTLEDSINAAFGGIDWGLSEESENAAKEWKQLFKDLFPEVNPSAPSGSTSESDLYDQESEDQKRRVMADEAAAAAAKSGAFPAFGTDYGPRDPFEQAGPSKSLINKDVAASAAKSTELARSGFSGLSELARMQADKAGGFAVGSGSSLSLANQKNPGGAFGRSSGLQTGSLGAKRKVGGDKESKKAETLQEKQVSSLESIDGKLTQALTVG